MYNWRVGRSARRFRSNNSLRSYRRTSETATYVDSPIASNEASRLLHQQGNGAHYTDMESLSSFSAVHESNPMLDADGYDLERGILNESTEESYQEEQDSTAVGNDEGNDNTTVDNGSNGGTDTGTGMETAEDNNNDDNNNPNDLSEEIQILTNRLRILFFTLTLPILPLGIILSLLILQLVYAATTSPSCGEDHPLRIYAFFTLIIATYATKHKAIRNWLFNYDRARDGMSRPRIVKIYDQCFHFLAIAYVYYGTVLVQSCEDDLVDVAVYPQQMNGSLGGGNDAAAVTSAISDGASATMGAINNATLTESTCAYSCPELFDSMQRYIFMLKIFVIVLLLPLVCLPFIYVWILRRINTEEAWLRFGREVNNGGGDGKVVMTGEIMDELEDVVLVPVREGQSHGSFDKDGDDDVDGAAFKRIRIVAKSVLGTDKDAVSDSKTTPTVPNHLDEEDPLLIPEETDPSQIKDWNTVKDCCICMCEFDICDQYGNRSGDDGDGDGDDGDKEKSNGGIKTKDIVRTKCGHIFHKSCIGSWIAGNWDDELNRLGSPTSRARRYDCPLCRTDLSPTDEPDEY